MTTALGELFEAGRPAPHSLEIDQVLDALRGRFGTGGKGPVVVGRYRVLGRIGSGGLGLVYRARDPSLDRFVAIKVLKSGREAAENDVRLLREAQVLAQIRHPNVVEVFDIGFFEDYGLRRFFVAMELVEGTDLRKWLRSGTRAATLDAFIGAAAGLQAAHAVGLLHRDFKPSNVLMGRDGAVKVADFGLAAVTRELRARAETAAWSAPDGVATPAWDPGGTPHYMSPEQHRGDELSTASDQYGFCVSLYEALHGLRPFEGNDHATLLAAKERGPEIPRTRGVNAALRRVLRRGLDPVPEERFTDMDALRKALGSARVGSRPWWIGGVAVAGAAAIGIGMFSRRDRSLDLEVAQCPELPSSLDAGASATSEPLRTLLQSSPALAELWPKLSEALDAYAHELRLRWDGSCALVSDEEAHVQRCLTRASEGLDALRAVFAKGDAELLSQGWSLLRELPDLHMCAPSIPDGLDSMERLQIVTVAQATLLSRAGRMDAAREVLMGLKEELREEGARGGLRHVEIELAGLSMLEGHYAEAREPLEAVYFEAAAQDDTSAAGRAAVRLVEQSYRVGDVGSALRWARSAHPQLDRMYPRDEDLKVVLWHNLALAHLASGDLELALTEIRTAVDYASMLGVSPWLHTGSQQVHAEILLHAGRPAEALAVHRSIPSSEQWDPRRDILAQVVDLQSLGNVLITLHDTRGARDAYLRSYELGRSVVGLRHPQTAAACISLARAEGDLGNVARGKELLAPCLESLEESLGGDHPHVAVARAMGARLAWQGGDFEEARRTFEQALASLESSFGGSHYVVADLLHEFGIARVAAGDLQQARGHFERALEIRRSALPDGHINTAETQAELALLDAADRRAGAEERLQGALEVFERR